MPYAPYVRATSWVLLLFFPIAMNAMPAQGTVQPQGTVTVNGKAVSSTTTLFAGDKVQTGAESLATLSSQGVMIQLQPNTTAIFSDRALDLGCGTAEVATSVGTMVRVAGITATPAAQNATRLKVTQMNGAVRITATENWAVVNDGRIRETLAPGQSATFSRPAATCDVVVHGVSQASTRVYLPATAIVVGLGIVTYCSANGWCSETSPAVP